MGSSSEELPVGIVGAGIIGGEHAKAIAGVDGLRVTAVADASPQAVRGFAEAYGVPAAFASWEELVGAPEVDVVLICTPNDLHLPIAAAAMDSGKHVICEKPLARTLAEGHAIAAKSRETGRRAFIALNHRYQPRNQKARELLDAGEIGKPFMAVSAFIGNEFARMNDPANWKGTAERSGGGVLIDNGTHMIDLLRWWLGDVLAVTARCGRLAISAINKEEDTAFVTLEFAGGAMAELSLTFGAQFSAWPAGYCGAAIRTEIIGPGGALRVGNDHFALETVIGSSRAAYRQSEITSGMPDSMHSHFAHCIRTGEQPLVTLEDGLAALEVVEAAYTSAREGRRVLLSEVQPSQ